MATKGGVRGHKRVWRVVSAPLGLVLIVSAALVLGAWVSTPASAAGNAPTVALTFDDGPGPTTNGVLDVLAREGVRATFFDVGVHVAADPGTVRRELADGHDVGNHSWSHAALTALPDQAIAGEIDRTQDALVAAGAPRPNCFRPPYGLIDGRVGAAAARAGTTPVLWTVDPKDWSRPGAAAIAARVLGSVAPGGVVLLHDGGGDRSQTLQALPVIIDGLKQRGYRFVSACPSAPDRDRPELARVTSEGGAAAPPAEATSAHRLVGLARTPTGRGAWAVARDGGVFSSGDASFFGSTGGIALRQPIVGVAATPSGHGYWLAAADGGVFSFGDAAFFGSTGGMTLNRPVVAIVATPSGRGYWLVASDGGVFTFGDAGYAGSLGGMALQGAVVGAAATPSGHGYWMVAGDGGVFSFGDAGFHGSAANIGARVVGVAADPSGAGYWLGASDGGVFTFGDAPFLGRPDQAGFEARAIASGPDGTYSVLQAAGR